MGGKITRVEVRIIDGVAVEVKECTSCGAFLALDRFGKNKRSLSGYKSGCKTCESARVEAYKRENPDKAAAYRRTCYERNPRYYAEYGKKHRAENPELYRLISSRRRARKNSLPDTLTKEQITIIERNFNGRCALSGAEIYELDHFIPISSGHGGTIYENIIPLSKELNSSKNGANPFEWFKRNQKRFELSKEKFDDVVRYLAKLNDMEPKYYVAYVYKCYGIHFPTYWLD